MVLSITLYFYEISFTSSILNLRLPVRTLVQSTHRTTTRNSKGLESEGRNAFLKRGTCQAPSAGNR